MKFVFLQFRRTEKMDSVIKGLVVTMPPPQNFWVRTTPGPPMAPLAPCTALLRPALIIISQLCPYK